jgi:hypothetical protein
MNPLDHLASLLRPAAQEGARELPPNGSIDKLLSEMEARSKGRKSGQLAEDQQLEAVRRFWDSQEVKSFRDAYVLSWSLSLPHRPQGACIIEDRGRLQRVLDGVDGWQGRPSAYRRCYQGLVKSYFTYDALLESVAPTARNNWRLLREYLYEHNPVIRDKHLNPKWVDAAVGNRKLFGEKPCEPYVDALLRGDSGVIDHLCEQLGINKASWFLRELVLAQVNGATLLGNGQFQELLPRLLSLLAANEVLRDRGMIVVLDRYAQLPGTPLHQGLRDHSVAWWGNPWLPSNETRWGGVKPVARTMVADWLKLEFIETFFTKLAEDGLGDPRRMNFWKRYVKSINHIEFALGSTARNSRERDMVLLRKKMTGLVQALDASGTNNAFIMRMGPLVAVEFSGLGNAFYGYDARKSIPFDTKQLLRLDVNGRNSLKHKGQSILWLSHQDGIHNWDKWEDMFAATLRKEFGIEPSATPPTPRRFTSSPRAAAPHASPAPGRAAAAAPQEYSRSALNKFAHENGLTIDDKTTSGGNLWVRVGGSDEVVSRVLTRWGFRNKPGKGWWR